MLPYLLLITLIAYSLHAADTPNIKTRKLRDNGKTYLMGTQTTHIPEMMPLPQNLTAVADTDEHNPYRVDGAFFPKAYVAFVSILKSLHPDKDLEANKTKLNRVQNLLNEGIKKGLQTGCNACLQHEKTSLYPKCPTCKTSSDYKVGNGRYENLFSIACNHVNETLYQELARDEKLDKRELTTALAQYKVVGHLFLASEKFSCRNELCARTCRKKTIRSSNILPCNRVTSIYLVEAKWCSRQPQL